MTSTPSPGTTDTVGAVKAHVSVGLARLRERMGPALDLVPTGEEGLS